MPDVVSSNTEVRTIRVEKLYEMLLNGEIVLPRFQRASVWPRESKRKLIDAIRRKLPIGSLLVYQSPDPGETGRKVLVDGLQRTLAIREYMQSPQSFITAESLRGSQTTAVVQSVLDIAEANDLASPEEQAIFACIESWVRSAEALTVEHLTADSLADLLDSELGLQATSDQKTLLRSPAYSLISHVQTDHVINTYPLALVEYTGPASRLPEIFKNINSAGVRLDDFDQFATDWIDFSGEVASDDVRTQINHKWEVALSKNLVVERWGSNGPTDGYTFWEYMYGLGRVIKAKHPFLFGSFSSDPDGTNTERVSFYLAALAHGLVPRVDDIRRLPFLLSSFSEGTRQLDMSRFEQALRKSCEAVEQWLKPSVGMRLNSALASELRMSNLSQLSQFLVLAMVARTLAGRWVPFTWEERTDWRSDWNSLKSELPRHLLYEMLQGSWSGAGDSNAFTTTWDGEQLKGTTLPTGFDPSTHLVASDMFARHRDANEWGQLLDIWLRGEISGAQRVYRSVSKEAKLVLRYVYSDIPLNWYEGNNFEIDHLLPVARLAGIIERDGGLGWPISAVGNLALFPSRVNGAKSDKTCREYLDSLTDEDRERDHPFIEYGAAYPLEDLVIPEVDGVDTLTRDEYVALVSSRQDVLKQKVINALGL